MAPGMIYGYELRVQSYGFRVQSSEFRAINRFVILSEAKDLKMRQS